MADTFCKGKGFLIGQGVVALLVAAGVMVLSGLKGASVTVVGGRIDVSAGG
jgi:hypothetical protein